MSFQVAKKIQPKENPSMPNWESKKAVFLPSERIPASICQHGIKAHLQGIVYYDKPAYFKVPEQPLMYVQGRFINDTQGDFTPNLWYHGKHVMGMAHGEGNEVFYPPSGGKYVAVEGNYANGKRHGEMRFFNSAYNLISKVNFAQGIPQGRWTMLESGDSIEFEDGVPKKAKILEPQGKDGEIRSIDATLDDKGCFHNEVVYQLNPESGKSYVRKMTVFYDHGKPDTTRNIKIEQHFNDKPVFGEKDLELSFDPKTKEWINISEGYHRPEQPPRFLFDSQKPAEKTFVHAMKKDFVGIKDDGDLPLGNDATEEKTTRF